MRRPLLYAAMAAALTLLFATLLPINFTFVLLGLLGTACVICVVLRGRPAAKALLPMFLTAVLSGAYVLSLTLGQVWPAQAFAGNEALVSGIIQDEPRNQDGKTTYVIKVDSSDLTGFPMGMKLAVSDKSAQRAEAFDRYTARVYLYKPYETERAGAYADGVYLAGAAVSGQTVERADKRPLYYGAIRIRRHIRDFFYSHLSYEEAGSLNGLVLGDKTGMSDEMRADLRDSGISHIMAVSGMHLAVICQGLLFLLRGLRVGRRPSAALGMAAVLLMMAVTGFSPSIMRAGVMYLILLAGRLIFARADSLNSLGGAVLVILALGPFTIGDLSFQLSVCATLGILLICPRLYGWLCRRLPEKGIGRILRAGGLILAQTLSCTLFTLPVILLRLDQMSLVSPLTNLAVSFAASAALLCGVLAVLFFLVPFLSFIGYPLLLAAGLLVRYIAGAAHFFGNLPFATLSTGYAYLQMWTAAVLVLAALAVLFSGRKKLWRFAALLSAVLLCVGGVSYALFTHGVTSVTLLDTESGLSVFLSRGSRCALIGTGGGSKDYYPIRGAMRAAGAGRLDLVALPALDQTYTGGAAAYVSSLAGTPAGELADFSDGTEARFWNDVSIFPVEVGEQAGAYLKVGETKFLLLPAPADCRDVPDAYRDCQVLFTTAGRLGGCKATAADVGLVSGAGALAPRAAALLSADGLPAYATGGSGGLTIVTRGRGDITLRRDRP